MLERFPYKRKQSNSLPFLKTYSQVKIGDFGISKVLENTADFAETQLGTPFYLSPEIVMG